MFVFVASLVSLAIPHPAPAPVPASLAALAAASLPSAVSAWSPASLLQPARGPMAWMPRPVAFPDCPVATGVSATVLIPSEAAVSQPGGALEPGDEIALLGPDGTCVGSGAWAAAGTAIAVWGDDPFTPTTEGLAPGAALQFSVWDASAGQAYPPSEVGVSFVPGYDAAGGFRVDGLYLVAARAPTATPPAPAVAAVATLDQNFPNPVRGRTQIEFSLPEAGAASLDVFDALGRHVRRIADGDQAVGPHTVAFDAAGLASGVYVYRLTVGETVLMRRMLVTR